MRLRKPALIAIAAVLAAPAVGAELRLAQNYGYPPADSYGQPTSDASLLVRIDRLEAQLRQMNGQIEQLQFQNRRLDDQLKKFQEDVDFRFQDGARASPPPAAAKPQKRGDALDDLINEGDAPGAVPSVTPGAGSPRPSRRGDAFDPTAEPAAPGAPRPLGSASSATPSSRARSAEAEAAAAPVGPLDLSGARWRGAKEAGGAPAASDPIAALATPNGLEPGAAPVNPVKEEFDVALGYYRQKQYETAEKSFAAFLQKNPKSRLAADATYYLGESYFQRSRPREAAEQYLKISMQYASSARAPDAMLRLGQSLNALGAKEQACATFAEIGRKYPNASNGVKTGAEREAKRVQC